MLGKVKTATHKKGLALMLLCLISLMAVLDTTIAALALPLVLVFMRSESPEARESDTAVAKTEA